MHKKILIKLSGEALGVDSRLFDINAFEGVAASIVRIVNSGAKVAVVIGAGNIWRGRASVGTDIDSVTADQMGMAATLINTLLMSDSITRAGANARIFCAFDAPRFAENFNQRKAIEAYEAGEVVLLAGGTGNPFFSTDTGAVLRAIELSADVILLAKNIDGVYDSDPAKNPNAKFLPSLTYDDAIENRLGVMDMSALVMLRENRFPLVHVFALKESDSLYRAALGEQFGSFVTLGGGR